MKQREIVRAIGQNAARIWLGDLPTRFTFEASDWLTHSINMKNRTGPTVSRSAGLRLKIHAFSGQLGAVFVPQEGEALTVKVGIADLRIPGLSTRKGIPPQYAQVIMDEVIKTAGEIDSLGAGILEFNHGGFDPVWSNERVFRVLARSVLLLLAPDLEDTQEGQILAVVARGIESFRND
jgi:hypothetical protein